MKQRESLTHAQTHTFNGPLSLTTQVSRYQKGKTNLDFTEASGSGICRSAPRSIQITTSAPHHTVFSKPDALPADQQRQSTEGTEENHPIGAKDKK